MTKGFLRDLVDGAERPAATTICGYLQLRGHDHKSLRSWDCGKININSLLQRAAHMSSTATTFPPAIVDLYILLRCSLLLLFHDRYVFSRDLLLNTTDRTAATRHAPPPNAGTRWTSLLVPLGFLPSKPSMISCPPGRAPPPTETTRPSRPSRNEFGRITRNREE